MANRLDVTGFVLLFVCECQCNLKSWLPCAKFACCWPVMPGRLDHGGGQIIDGMSQFRLVHKIARSPVVTLLPYRCLLFLVILVSCVENWNNS